jgi:glycosyltransferase involved in cell wall biosynthesis
MKSSILIIGPTPPPRHGVSTMIQLILESPLARRFRVSQVELADRRGIAYVDKPDLHDVRLFLRQWVGVLAALRKRPQVTYLALSQSTIGFLRDSFFLWPAWMLGSRTIVHLHGGDFRRWYRGRTRLMQAYVRGTMRRVSRGIVLSESLRVQFDGLLPADRIIVVPNGVPWERSSTDCGRTWPKRGSCRVLYLGTLNRSKGTLVLLTAIATAARVRPDVEFVLAGPWSHAEDEQEAASFVAAEGLAATVLFPGPVEEPEKHTLFESADLFVFPSIQQEGQPLVVLEAMAAGLPVLYTDRGCLRDTVPDGECGLVVRPGDPEDLAHKLLRLLDDPALLKRLGMKSRERYRALYSAERFLTAVQTVFERAAMEPEG